MKTLKIAVLIAMLVNMVFLTGSAPMDAGPVSPDVMEPPAKISPRPAAVQGTGSQTVNGWPPTNYGGSGVATNPSYPNRVILNGNVGDYAWALYVFTLPPEVAVDGANLLDLTIGFYGGDFNAGGDPPAIELWNYNTSGYATSANPAYEATGWHMINTTALAADPVSDYVDANGQVWVRIRTYPGVSAFVDNVKVSYIYNKAPNQPILVTPADHAINISTYPTFTWNKNGNDSSVSYTVRLQRFGDVGFTAVPGCIDVFTSTCTATGFPAAGTPLLPGWAYDWKVQATDVSTYTVDSTTIRQFTTYGTCHELTFNVFGNSGVEPVTSPANSTGCPANHYYAGTVVNLTAQPDMGKEVYSWTFTDDDTLEGLNNTITMPNAAHAVDIVYEPSCYKLTAAHTGTGLNPTASPLRSSPTCDPLGDGYYIYDEAITMTAYPDLPLWYLASWTGTSGAFNNTFTMPPYNHTITANYSQACYSLTLTHNGNGANPTANPTKSVGCDPGKYLSGELITLSATPDFGYSVSGWTGTDNDISTSSTNTLTMPNFNANGSVTYAAAGATATINGSVSLTGRPVPPNNQWLTNLTVKLLSPGTSTVHYTFTVNTDNMGEFSIPGLVPGTYDIQTKGATTLQNKLSSKVISTGLNAFTMGTLKEGDSNNDNYVNATDFSLLAASYGKCLGTSGYNDYTDFNNDNCVTGADFSLLAANYGLGGQ
jgi:Divergent InlB B-repeat domain/Dockerin type I domain